MTFIIRYHSKNAPDFLTKMNNIVWSCCVLHNLLLGIDGLDKLWTKDDYLSTWYFVNLAVRAAHTPDYRYADPDADHHSEFDVQTEAHAALIRQRALSRARQFNRSRLGDHRPGDSSMPSHVVSNVALEDDYVVLQGEPGWR